MCSHLRPSFANGGLGYSPPPVLELNTHPRANPVNEQEATCSHPRSGLSKGEPSHYFSDMSGTPARPSKNPSSLFAVSGMFQACFDFVSVF